MIKLICILITTLMIVSSECDIQYNGLNEDEQNFILKLHNDLRNDIKEGKISGQPKAKEVKTLSWDDCLADEAQRIANNCELKHQPASCPQLGNIGQNILRTTTTKDNHTAEWERAILFWFDENKLFKFGSKDFTGVTHYTQMVWSTTEKIGCGYSFCNQTSEEFLKLYFCHYYPRGNYQGQDPYTEVLDIYLK